MSEVAPTPLAYATLDELETWARSVMRREPDYCIGGLKNPYMRRWFILPRNPFANLYLHEIVRSDDDRALHDHPWPSRSLVVAGGYFEHLPDGSRHWRAPGWTGDRAAEQPHRLEVGETPAISLFFTGQKTREWGFHCPNGWRHWQDFTGGEHGEIVGRGCE